ncbi:hypothetical protein PtA15_18A91 [Puccinia triticina]|uniref:Uncharacterized protein n=1 Tax=Puccinia triticina TaxID=208348 RepID=A0ABY7DAJ0_9BASI|nr:uncharacterized protein PtA15_18A91 [Puccinia triticina]WAQ93035.1 hypothetical protein PtA15_18A91 [Puccinia triticina]
MYIGGVFHPHNAHRGKLIICPLHARHQHQPYFKYYGHLGALIGPESPASPPGSSTLTRPAPNATPHQGLSPTPIVATTMRLSARSAYGQRSPQPFTLPVHLDSAPSSTDTRH